ncbi:MAG: hypothetical protein ABGX69_04980 [Methylococcales bacterium]
MKSNRLGGNTIQAVNEKAVKQGFMIVARYMLIILSVTRNNNQTVE